MLLAGGCDGRAPGPAPSGTQTASVTPTGPCDSDTVLASWPLARLAAQTVVVPINSSQLATVGPQVAAGVGGVILFGAQAPDDLKDAVAALVAQAPDGIEPFIMTDEEGGDVQRLPNLVGRLPSARDMAATMTPEQIYDLALQAGTVMLANGVTMDLAPVLDLDDRPGPNNSNPDGTRSFSRDRTVATLAGLAFAHGLVDAGVIPVVKHFPGLGGTNANTDVAPAATLPWDELQRDGLLPFTAAIEAGLPAIMVSNASVPGLTALPASISPEVITGVLRQQLHFDGLVMTDALSGGAIEGAGHTVPSASVAALAAGADIILFTAIDAAGTTRQTIDAIVAAVEGGQVPRDRLEDAVRHIFEVKRVDLCA